eukprot:TRINITY_DN3217_c0_g1_i4.p1 TRINITY_DN3217_c0_g1~~TRINITY_DN3217_c0_g1_i4.p1  ORF type:complete len:194 (-),score=33.34 TRINITY_DN3217_c0_g1_i4:589-1170(-)
MESVENLNSSPSSSSNCVARHKGSSFNRLWKKEEDKVLTEVVEEHGTNWPMVAETFYKRTGTTKSIKQCRERWKDHINPVITKMQFTEEEAQIIFKAHREHGKKWVSIAKLLPQRSDNQIKNFFYCRLRKVVRNLNKDFKASDIYKKLNLNESILLAMMKKFDITLGDVCTMPLNTIGSHLLKFRRKRQLKAE